MASEIEKRFFYASSDARYYDGLAELTQPHIDLIHDTMIDLLTYSLKERGHSLLSAVRLLVIGSGTGAEVFRILERFPNVSLVTIDVSPEMNAALGHKFTERFPGTAIENKLKQIEADFFDDACTLKAVCGSDSALFDAVVAGFFLHHYDDSVKRLFYRRAAELIAHAGILVHGDLFNFRSQSVSAFAHDFGERWMRRQMTEPDPHLRARFDSVGSEIHRLRDEWLKHWNTDHIYTPIESTSGPNQRGTHVVGQAEMASDAGFGEVECPFRFWEVGVLWARK